MPGLEGTNREWLRTQNEYDLLLKVNNQLLRSEKLGKPTGCVMALLDPTEFGGAPWARCSTVTCGDCITIWLNAKH